MKFVNLPSKSLLATKTMVATLRIKRLQSYFPKRNGIKESREEDKK